MCQYLVITYNGEDSKAAHLKLTQYCKSSVQYKINKRYPCDSATLLKFGTIACNDLFPIPFKSRSRVNKLK